MGTENENQTDSRARPGRKPKADAADAAVAVATAPVVARVGPVMVKAKHPGTYPNPGDTYGRLRKRGDIFRLNQAEDFAPEWMVDVSDEDQPLPPESDGRLPQTTGPRRFVPSTPPLQ